jgi:hypothetical protein
MAGKASLQGKASWVSSPVEKVVLFENLMKIVRSFWIIYYILICNILKTNKNI